MCLCSLKQRHYKIHHQNPYLTAIYSTACGHYFIKDLNRLRLETKVNMTKLRAGPEDTQATQIINSVTFNESLQIVCLSVNKAKGSSHLSLPYQALLYNLSYLE